MNATAQTVYEGSDGELTKRFYAELSKHGAMGLVAMNLFRAQKCSARAKVYRGGVRGKGSFKRMAYDRKQWSIENLCSVLDLTAKQLGITFGWLQDPDTPFGEQPSWVLYVDLPVVVYSAEQMSAIALESGAPAELKKRQVSFHSPTRGAGPDYPGKWDGEGQSAARIIEFCDSVLRGKLKL